MTDLFGPDPDAPYGRKADGSPKEKPGRKPAGATRRRGTRPPRATAGGANVPGPRPHGKPSTPEEPVTPGRGAQGLLGALAALLVVPGRNNVVYMADAGALTMWAPTVGQGVDEVLEAYPALADRLSWLGQAGPCATLLGAVVGLGAQLAANHRVIPPAVAQNLGVVNPQHLADNMAEQVQRMAREAQREANRRAAQATPVVHADGSPVSPERVAQARDEVEEMLNASDGLTGEDGFPGSVAFPDFSSSDPAGIS